MKRIRCGGCQYYQKMKTSFPDDCPGLCLFFDQRTKSDYGCQCSNFKAIPYKYKKKYKENYYD